MTDDPQSYVKSVLVSYLSLPDTPTRVSRFDRRLALELFQRAVPRPTVEAAFLLASARRICRPADAPPLGPIRSLHYFLPVIEEVLLQPPASDYLRYLRSKLAPNQSRKLSTTKLLP